MQTIARANRVNDGKENGLIEDYIGIVTALEKALVDYTTSGGGNAGNGHKVTIDREKLVAAIYEDAALAIGYLKQHGFEIKNLINSRNFARIKMIQTGANSVAAPDEVKKEFKPEFLNRIDDIIVFQKLNGEKIDIINYDEDISNYIENAISPAKSVAIVVDEDSEAALVIVPDLQLSLAIGREGQNARLAAKLTNWKIDIKSESQFREYLASMSDAEDEEDIENVEEGE